MLLCATPLKMFGHQDDTPLSDVICYGDLLGNSTFRRRHSVMPSNVVMPKRLHIEMHVSILCAT